MRDTNGRRGTAITFLGRLARDTRGNTLAIAAAAMFPLLGMIGSGLDMGRAYLVKTRLQQACDAGVLAARKSMSTTTLDASARAQAASFFNINLRAAPYPANADGSPGTGAYGSTVQPLQLSDVLIHDAATGMNTPNGTVRGVATATVPMTIMKLFGTDQMTLSVTCDAEQNVSNQDILFVLDTTGSMACLPADSSGNCDSYVVSATTQDGSVWKTTEKTNSGGSRIDALRAAVKSFFAVVDAAKAPGARLRIGFLPYSSGVNVGGILPNDTLDTSPITYQTRVYNFTSPVHRPTTSIVDVTETYPSNINATNCAKYGSNTAFTGFAPSAAAGTAPTATVKGGNLPAAVTTYQYAYLSGPSGTNTGTCRRTKRTSTTTYATRYALTNWTYKAASFPVTNYVAGTESYVASVSLNSTSATVTTAEVATTGSYTAAQLGDMVAAGTATGMTASPTTWDGCIEERLSGDADINGPATSAATRWRPAWRDVSFGRSAAAEQTNTSSEVSPFWRAAQTGAALTQTAYSCPKAATLPTVMTAAAVNDYVEAPDFVPHGRTYHDIGMIWGARIMSTTSVFSALHTGAPNGKPISRNIIFMTDGEMKPLTSAYSPYGIERVDRRVMPSGTLTDATLATRHIARFLAACQAAQDNGVNVWVVAFGQTLTTDLTTCASSDSQAYEALDATSLNTALAQIAQRIADLRLTS